MYSDVSLFIDGEWTAGTSGKSEPIINPATGKTLARLAHASTADLDRALAAADKGFKQWRAVSAFERYKVLRKAADLMRERAGEIGELMTLEQGKPLVEAKGEAMSAADLIDWFAEEAAAHLRPDRAAAHRRREPARDQGTVGVVAAFTPELPLNQAVRKVSAALRPVVR